MPDRVVALVPRDEVLLDELARRLRCAPAEARTSAR